MSQQSKSELYQELKAAGVELGKPYRNYTVAELQEAHDALRAGLAAQEAPDEPLPTLEGWLGVTAPEEPSRPESPPEPSEAVQQAVAQPTAPSRPSAPLAERDPDEMAGARLNRKPADEPIRTDEQGRVWFQEMVLKPAFAKPRGRRVLKYMESGTKQQTVQDGEYIETFEVSGDQPAHLAEVKITLPSYQVGIYKDPRFPFKVHVYGEKQGFDREEVDQFYGGRELVPEEIKRIYVENVLCYDMRTVVRAIQTEFRQQQLAGRIR